MTEPERARRGVRSTLLRWRAPIVLLPLVAGLGYSGVLGAQLLWGEDAPTSASEPVVTCWDGSKNTGPDCPAPTGLPGLRWVFPAFQPFNGACDKVVYEGGRGRRPLQYVCKVRRGASTVRVTYSERSDLEGGLNYFEKRYDGIRPVRTAGGSRLIYRDPAPGTDGTYEATVALTAYPFAVTVTAVNERLRDAALEEVVTYRADRFLTIRPAQTPTARPSS